MGRGRWASRERLRGGKKHSVGWRAPGPQDPPSSGWLQVNRSQPPTLLNSHGAPQPWCLSRGGAGWLEGDVVSSSHWPQTLQEMAAQSGAPARVGPMRGVGVRDGPFGHCPVAMAPGWGQRALCRVAPGFTLADLLGLRGQGTPARSGTQGGAAASPSEPEPPGQPR